MKKAISGTLFFLLILSGCQKEIRQELDQPFLKADTARRVLPGIPGAIDSLAIQSNINWTITISPANTDWLQVAKTTGKGNGTIYLTTIQNNTSGTTREAIIIITPSNPALTPIYITIAQITGLAITPGRNVYGGSARDEFVSAVATPDGGMIAIGSTRSADFDLPAGDRDLGDMWVVKTNGAGGVIWQKPFGGSLADFGIKIIAAQGSGYLVTGSTESKDGFLAGNHGYADASLIKLDENGNVVWKKLIGGQGDDYVNTMHQTTDGGYILAGMSSSNSGSGGVFTGSDAWVVKVDGNANILWQKYFGGIEFDYVSAILPTPDGGYLAAGTAQNPSFETSAWIFKLDATGAMVWQKKYGGSDYDVFTSMVPSGDGGYVIAGGTSSKDGDVTGNHGLNDGWVMKIDGLGNKLWQKAFGGVGSDVFSDMIKTADNFFVLAGWSDSRDLDPTQYKGGDSDGWVIKMDGNGNQMAQKFMGGSDEDYGDAIVQTGAGKYVLVGSTGSLDKDIISPNKTYYDAWLMPFSF
jgi:hypothetical protein